MYNTILVRYGEIILKGNNRRTFERKLIDNIKTSLVEYNFKIIFSQARIYIEPDHMSDMNNIIKKLQKVFGIVSVSPVIKVASDLEIIQKTVVELVQKKVRGETFKVETRRGDKSFFLTSPEVSSRIGGYILEKCIGKKVDVVNPQFVVDIEIRENTYIYLEKIECLGGMPTGTNGKGLLLLSGGIDSPVAGFMLARRGVEVDAIHFFSPPYTGPKAREKVIKLSETIATYTGRVNLHIVNFTEAQIAIRDNCPKEQLVIIMRRIMMRIACILAKKIGADSLITGENIGQVASQTMQAIKVTNEVATIPVFRPLIGFDKNNIIDIARKIDTYETSILPYEDCCTVFVPKHPETKPKLEKIKISELRLDIDSLIGKAMCDISTIKIARDSL